MAKKVVNWMSFGRILGVWLFGGIFPEGVVT
jgi:hypothetical protein